MLLCAIGAVILLCDPGLAGSLSINAGFVAQRQSAADTPRATDSPDPARPVQSKFPPHEEEEDRDPYLPGEGIADERGGMALNVGVQVNVNGAGQNILNDAANEPSMAVDPLDPR